MLKRFEIDADLEKRVCDFRLEATRVPYDVFVQAWKLLEPHCSLARKKGRSVEPIASEAPRRRVEASQGGEF